MKYLTLLLALVLPLSGQTLTNTNLDGVTNATINGKLDDDASATRTALGLGTAATTTAPVFHVADYGAVGDTRIVSDAIMTASSATLTSATAAFVAGDVGKFIEVLGAGTAGATLHTTISSVTNGTTVVLSASAGTTTVAARTITSVSTTLGSRTLTCAGGAFTNADLGKALISATSYPVETLITSIISGTQVEMSRPAAGTSGGQTIVVPGATSAFGTDDTVSIQNALEAAKTAGGGIVQLRKGTYFVNVTSLPVGATHGHCIKVHSNTTLQGVGMGASVIRAMSNQSNCPVLFGSGNVFGIGGTDYYTRIQNVTIRDLTVDGNKYLKTKYTGTGAGATGGEDEGINFYGVDRLRIFNVEVKDCLADGIDLDGVGDDCSDVVFDGLRIVGNNVNGMHLEADNLRVSNCHFEGNCSDLYRSFISTYPGAGAFETRQGDLKTLSNCTFLNNDIDLSASATIVSGCTFQNGIGLTSVNDQLHSGTVLTGCSWNIYGACPVAITVNASPRIIYGTPSNGDTVVVNGATFTKVASAPTGNQFSTIGELEALVEAVANLEASNTAEAIYITSAAGSVVTLTVGGGNSGTMLVYGAIPTGKLILTNCAITSGGRAIDVVSGKTLEVSGCSITSALDAIRITCLNGGSSNITSNVKIHSNSGNAVRVECVEVVTIAGNNMSTAAVYVVDFRAGSGHVARGNLMIGSVSSLRCTISNGNFIIGNYMTGTLDLGSTTATAIGNRVGNILLSTGASDSNVIKDNYILGTFTVSNSGAASNIITENIIDGAITMTGGSTINGAGTWRRNTGAGCAGVFSGSAPLVAGTATITTAAANSARKFSVTRQAPNASTALGTLTIWTVNNNTNFLIEARKSDVTVETGDLSTVYWEILE